MAETHGDDGIIAVSFEKDGVTFFVCGHCGVTGPKSSLLVCGQVQSEHVAVFFVFLLCVRRLTLCACMFLCAVQNGALLL